MTICSVYPIENYNRGMGGNSNFSHSMLPTYRGYTHCIWIYTKRKRVFAQTNFITQISDMKQILVGEYTN